MAWAALEKITTTVAAGAVTAVLGAAFVTWDRAADATTAIGRIAESHTRTAAELAARIADLEKLRDQDERADDAEFRGLDRRLSELDGRIREHQAWGKQWTEDAARRQLVCERRLSKVEDAVIDVERRFNSWVNEKYNGRQEWRN